VFEGPPEWRAVPASGGITYDFQDTSTYLALAPYFENMPREPAPVRDVFGARELAIFGDSITTDHISPAGSIKTDGPAGEYLISYQVRPSEFNTYGARRGNHNVMMRGTFANIRIRNEMVPGVEGGMTKLMPDGTVMSIYDAAMEYKKRGVPLVIFGGKEYGTGSSRDWAAKGTLLLGVKAVIVESFERIHRSNLVGMGVLPLQFRDGVSRQTLKLTGAEMLDIVGVEAGLKPRMELTLRIHDPAGGTREEPLICRIDTLDEVEYFRHGGILQYVLRGLLKEAA
jgi:aconitate hydratase